jgi:NAD+ kinase
MRVAIHGRARNEVSVEYIRSSLATICESVESAVISVPLKELISGDLPSNTEIAELEQITESQPDVLISLGGDGTILESARVIGSEGVPILGINTGRLGFLSHVGQDEVEKAMELLNSGSFAIEDRMLLHFDFDENPLIPKNFALNEVALLKTDSSSMIVIHAHVDGAFLNSYWADGLIIATPTGSTGYSLSCGGPIIEPGSDNIIITPIAPHNLNVRPLIIGSSAKLQLRTDSNNERFRVSADSSSCIVSAGTELNIERAKFCTRLVRFPDTDYFQTLRSKLMWGIDRRN